MHTTIRAHSHRDDRMATVVCLSPWEGNMRGVVEELPPEV